MVVENCLATRNSGLTLLLREVNRAAVDTSFAGKRIRADKLSLFVLFDADQTFASHICNIPLHERAISDFSLYARPGSP